MTRIEELKALYQRALKKRQPWEAGYQDCYDYAFPGRTSFFQRAVGADAPEIFDETAVIGVQEFASRIQQGLTPNYTRWFQLEAGTDVPPEQRAEVNEALDAVSAHVHEVISQSNFAQEAAECYYDVSLGTAAMDVVEGDALNPVIFNAVPLPDLALDSGPNDELGSFFRTRMVQISHIESAYPGAKVPPEMKDKAAKQVENAADKSDPRVKVVLACYRDWKVMNEEVHHTVLFAPDYDAVLFERTERGAGSGRMIGFRWSKATGEVWGRGPLFNTMPAVRTANLVVQMVLENAEMAIAGIYTAEDDGVANVSNIRLLPGTIVPIAPGSAGLQAVRGAGNFDVSQLVLGEMRQNIRKALYNETLGDPNRTPMSATEVSQRMADLSRQIGSAFGRLQIEFVNRLVQRVIYILKKRGEIELPVVNGREIKIVSTSPLSQAQAVEDINAVNNYLALIGQHYGPQMVNLYTDGAEVAMYLKDKFNLPEKLVRNEQGRQQLGAQIAQLQGAGAGGEMSGGQALPSIGA